MTIQLLSLSKIIRYVSVSSQEKHWSTRAFQATKSAANLKHTLQLTNLAASRVVSPPSATPPFWKFTVEACGLAGWILPNLQLRGTQFMLLIQSSVCSNIYQSKQPLQHHDQITVPRNKLMFCSLDFCLVWFCFYFCHKIIFLFTFLGVFPF